eukprot:5931069-Amphidinium_carterae.1
MSGAFAFAGKCCDLIFKDNKQLFKIDIELLSTKEATWDQKAVLRPRSIWAKDWRQNPSPPEVVAEEQPGEVSSSWL